MKTSKYWSTARPDLAMQWPNGTGIVWARGAGMSTCAPEWRKLFIAEVIELVEMGADAFFFDEFPGSPGGDWNPACRALYKERYGEDMPTEHAVTSAKGLSLPQSTSRQVLELMSDVTEQYFAELVAAISNATAGSGRVRLHRTASTRSTAAAPAGDGSVALLSTHLVPAPDAGGSLYETTTLLNNGPHATAKSEFGTGARTQRCSPLGVAPVIACYDRPGSGVDPFPEDVLAAFGWAMMRDGATGHPAHIWIPLSSQGGAGATAEQAVATVVATRAYGNVANPDHSEAKIPDHSLFDVAYNVSAKLDDLPEDLAPIRHTAVLFSESSRDHWITGPDANGTLDISTAWTKVLLPTVGAWGELLRAGAAAAVLTDAQLLRPDGGASGLPARWPVLLAPESAVLTAAVDAAVVAYGAQGGAVVRLPTAGWATTADRRVSGQQLMAAINSTGPGLGPVLRHGISNPLLHIVAMESTSTPTTTVVFVVNNFSSWTPSKSPGSGVPPSPVRGVAVALKSPKGLPQSRLTRAVDVLTGRPLEVTRDATAPGEREWVVTVGTVAAHVVLEATFE